MTTHLVIEIISITMLLLLALPGTQVLWTKRKSIAEKNVVLKRMENTSALSITDLKIKPIGFYKSISKIAAAIF